MASQLLAINVGNAKLLQKLTSVMACWDSKGDTGSLETGLWSAVEMGLSTINSREVHTVIIVDALDEIADGDAKASVFCGKLHSIANKLSLARAITLSRSATQPAKRGVRNFTITSEDLREDIRTYPPASPSPSSPAKKQQVFLKLIESRVNGSFLDVYLISKLLAAGADFDAVNKSLSSNPLNSNISRLFTFIIAAQRPLTAGKIENILRVNLPKLRVAPSINLAKLVSTTTGLIVIRNSIIRFKHASIQSHILKQYGHALPSLKDDYNTLSTDRCFTSNALPWSGNLANYRFLLDSKRSSLSQLFSACSSGLRSTAPSTCSRNTNKLFA
ncbi:hypothetical protein PG984_009092 [Apiospora sp. TS-2023a]